MYRRRNKQEMRRSKRSYVVNSSTWKFRGGYVITRSKSRETDVVGHGEIGRPKRDLNQMRIRLRMKRTVIFYEFLLQKQEFYSR